ERRNAPDVRILNALETGHARLLEQLNALTLKVRGGPILAVHAAEPRLVNHRRTEIRCQRDGEVEGWSLYTCGTECRPGTLFVLRAVVAAEPHEELVVRVDFLIQAM